MQLVAIGCCWSQWGKWLGEAVPHLSHIPRHLLEVIIQGHLCQSNADKVHVLWTLVPKTM